ncbi:MAG: Ribonuclease [Anaerolineales bacterium]|nr:Ribonuclease [Anaerolineales bacterium]
MRLHFHGAAHTVTGSQHLIEINGAKLLLECGLYQGRRAEAFARNRNFKYDARSVDAVILSHSHIDHCGNLPNLVKQGFSGPIYLTKPAAALTDVMLRDSGHIQESDAEYLNKKRRARGEPLIEPLYTQRDAEAVVEQFAATNYDETFEPVPGVKARFVEAGHILGSAAVSLKLEEKGRRVKFWFSGDIGRFHLPLLRDPILPEETDVLLMESTYGDKPHRGPQLAYEEFREVVKRTQARGGKIIIPAFAVGRTQELVYWLNQMMHDDGVKMMPVYVDSPLAVNASDIFKRFADTFDEETRAFVRENRHPALDFKQLTYIRSVDDSKALNERRDPMIIISASGMAETGRILHHLKNNIENPNNTVCIVSWQAPDTLGRRLADHEKQVRIFGEVYNVRAEVSTIGGLSGHAGQDLLMQYALHGNGKKRQVFLVHGEEKPATILKNKLGDVGVSRVEYPDMQDSVEL